MPATAQSLDVEPRWETKGSDNVAYFGFIKGMAEAGDGSVWIGDGINNALFRLNPDGTAQEMVAREGDGPGEVRGPVFLEATPSGGIAVYDIGHNAIEVFGGDGRFSHRVPLETSIVNPKGFAVLPTGDFVVTGGTSGNCCGVHWYSEEGDLARSTHEIPRTRNPRAGLMTAGGPVEALPNGDLLYSRASPHGLIIYPANGSGPRLLASDPDLLEFMGDDFIQEEGSGANLRRTFEWYFPQSLGVYRLEGGNVLNVVWFHDRGESLWELYSPRGALLVRTTVDRAYEPWNLTRDGDVLASYRDPVTDEHIAVRLVIIVRQ